MSIVEGLEQAVEYARTGHLPGGIVHPPGEAPIVAREPLYKYDSKGKLRIWWMEREGSKHRTVAGLDGGKLTTSAWTVCIGKQKRTDEQQAQFEIDADYTYQLKRQYFLTPEEAVGGARYFKPQLAQKFSDVGGWEGMQKRLKKSGFVPTELNTGVFSQPKFDGFCCIIQASGMTSREGEDIVSAPHIFAALESFFEQHPEAVLHGELYNHDMKDDFETLSSILRTTVNLTEESLAFSAEHAQFHMYDYADPSVRDLRFSERFQALQNEIAPHMAFNPCLWLAKTTPVSSIEHLHKLNTGYVTDGYEGQIVRLELGGYEQKRSWQVLKHKAWEDDEFEVVEIHEGVGNYAGYAKSATFWLKDADRSKGPTKDNTFDAGIKGGLKPHMKIDAFRARGDKVATVEFFGYTMGGEGKPRFARAIKWWGQERTL